VTYVTGVRQELGDGNSPALSMLVLIRAPWLPERVFRDPNSIPGHKSGERISAKLAPGRRASRQVMDAQFCAAMQRAGFSLTSPSTVPGTRAPIVGYRRDRRGALG
jgi:hypothetical protein